EQPAERAAKFVLRLLVGLHLGRIAQVVAVDLHFRSGGGSARGNHRVERRAFLFGGGKHDFLQVGNQVGAFLKRGFHIGPLGLGVFFRRRHGIDAARRQRQRGEGDQGGTEHTLEHSRLLPRKKRREPARPANCVI